MHERLNEGGDLLRKYLYRVNFRVNPRLNVSFACKSIFIVVGFRIRICLYCGLCIESIFERHTAESL